MKVELSRQEAYAIAHAIVTERCTIQQHVARIEDGVSVMVHANDKRYWDLRLADLASFERKLNTARQEDQPNEGAPINNRSKLL